MKWALALLLLLCACGEPGDDPALVELGTDHGNGFESIVDEQDLSLHAGLQGGYHFIVHARALDIDPGDPTLPGTPDNPRTSFSAKLEDGTPLSLTAPPHRLGYDAVGDWLELPGPRILQVDNDLVDLADGARVEISVSVADDRGSSASSNRWVRVVAPAE